MQLIHLINEITLSIGYETKEEVMDWMITYQDKSHTSPTHTREQCAKIAGVSAGTVACYNKVMNSNEEDLKEKISSNIKSGIYAYIIS